MATQTQSDDPTTWFQVGDGSGKKATSAATDDPVNWFPVGKEATPPPGKKAAWWDYSAYQEPGTEQTDIAPDPRVAASLGRIGSAVAGGWQGFNPESPDTANNNQQSYIGQYFTHPLVQTGSVPFRAMGAMGAGTGQAAYELGNLLDPRLGRDLYMMNQVGGALLPQVAGPRAGLKPPAAPEVNQLQPKFIGERTAPPRPEGMTDAERIQQLIAHDDTETGAGPRVGGVPPAEEPHGAVNTAGDVHAGEAPSPQSGGAAATPGEAIPDQTRVERARNLRVSINESARDRAGPRLTDDTAYVPDIPPRMRPERDFSPQTALDHKERYGEDAPGYRAEYDANTTERNAGMKERLEADAGDEITLDQSRKARREVAPDAFGAFEGEQPVDASGLRARIQGVLDGPEGKREAVERTLNNVLGRLHDREGNLETMPSTLYGVRKHIDDLIEKARKPADGEGHDAAVSVHILRDLLPETDDLIQSGAGRYQAYRDAYREASQPVNQQRFLQQYQGGTKKITDGSGNLQLERLNRMLEGIHKGLTDTKFNLAQSLTDAQIRNVVNVRNELAAKALRDEQAKVPGSPTVQLLNQAAKRGTGPLAQTLRGTAEAVAHGAGIVAHMKGVPYLNVPMGVYSATFPYRQARREAKARAKVEAGANALKQQLLSQDPVNPLSEYQ